MENPVKSWSYSAYSLYDQCPAKYKYLKIDKLPEPRSEALIRGDLIHKEIEAYLTGVVVEIPESAKNFADLLPSLKAIDPYVEQSWGFDSKWKNARWNDWKNCWLRVKTDVCIVYPDDTGEIIDHKTGKKYGENKEQLDLFALAAMHRHPEVKNWTLRLWYLDSGEEVIDERNRSTKDKMKAEWLGRIGPMFADTTFAPRPNRFCRWCHFRKSNGGPCSHG